jgi:hypothetical protein
MASRPTPRAEAGPRQAALWAGLAAVTLAGTLVFWCFDALPFQDLPEHAGLIALRHRFADSTFDQRFFVVAPHLGPYSLFRFLGDRLVGPLGPVGAVRAIATLPLVATPLALGWARWRLHGDRSPTAAFFGVALSFGLMTLLGFASYLLGIAVLIVALTNWLELLAAVDAGGSPSSRWREVAVALTTPFVLLVHGHAFVLLLALAGMSALAAGDRGRRFLRTRALAPALGLAAWTAWLEHRSAVPAGSAPLAHAALSVHFQGPFDKLSLLVTPTLMTRTGVDVLVGLVIWSVVLAGAAATARSLRRPDPDRPDPTQGASRAHARALLVSTAALLGVFLALPHSIGWFGFVDGRLVPCLCFLPIMAIRRGALGNKLELAFDTVAPIAATAMVAIALIASHLFQAEAAGWREVLAEVPSDDKLLYLPIDPNSHVLTAHPFAHYDKLVMADRPTVVGDLWFHQGSAVYPTRKNPALALPASYSASDLRSVDWPAYRLGDWDCVLVRTDSTAAKPEVPGTLSLVVHRGGWWLFRTRLDARP